MPLSRNATFRQLTAFHTFARLGSVSLAADELHLTQPAVSIQIGALEASAGTPLLQRTGRGVRLTEAGELLAGYASRIVELWREAGEEMATLQGVFSGTLRVGTVTTAEYLLPPLLVSFIADRPKVKVKLQVGNRDEIVRMLAGQEIDIAIMGRPPAELKTDSRTFARHPMAFLAAPSDPLMAVRGLTLAESPRPASWCASAVRARARPSSACSATSGCRCASAPSCRATRPSSACARPASALRSCRCTPACSRSMPAC